MDSRGLPTVAIDVRQLQVALRNWPVNGLGGVGRYIHELVKALVSRRDSFHYVLLIDFGTVHEDLACLAEQYRTSLYRVGFPFALDRLRRHRTNPLLKTLESRVIDAQVSRLGPDLLHFTQHPPEYVRFRPVAVTLHDVASWPERISKSRLRLRDADAVLCDSRATAREAEYLLGASPGRITVAYPGIDSIKFRPGGIEKQSASRATYFLHVGTLRANKNPHGVLRAFAEMAHEQNDISLISVGPYEVLPAVRRDVQSLVNSLGLKGRVSLKSGCDDQTLVRLYQQAACLVFPSFKEGFGFPILEALACGTPCITSNVSSMPELSGGLCQLVDPNDPTDIALGMRRVLGNADLKNRVQTEGPAWAGRFTWEATAEVVANVYTRLICGPLGRRVAFAPRRA